jgi:hypothetical protein
VGAEAKATTAASAMTNVVKMFNSDQELSVVARFVHQAIKETGTNWLHFTAAVTDDKFLDGFTAEQKRQLVLLVRGLSEQTPEVPPDAA